MSERSDVQQPMLTYAAQIGWHYVAPDEALRLRGGDTGLFFGDVLRDALLRLNPSVVEAANVGDILRQLHLLRPTIEGNRDALTWLRGEQSVFVPADNCERNVRLIDFENTDNNVFHVTDEWRQRGVVPPPNRTDVVFLINGIPVAIAETKATAKRDGLSLAIDQIRRYHRETPEMFTSAQVFEVTQLLDFYYGATWVTSRKSIFNWKDVVSGSYERVVTDFFDRRRFVRLLRDYILFLDRNDEMTKVTLRQHQIRAVEKTLARAGDLHKRRGLVWHTQGSGKTLTMLTIAARLLQTPAAEKPTVLVIVDRLDLEDQLDRTIASYGIGTVRLARRKDELRDILASDYRGLVVSMIHKFDDISANMSTRSIIIVLIDEAHRTTGGDLGTYLMAALPNATYIGFTYPDYQWNEQQKTRLRAELYKSLRLIVGPARMVDAANSLLRLQRL